jgi:hypothetical protein
MQKKKKLKRMTLVSVILLLIVWMLVAHFTIEERIGDDYAKKIFLQENVELFTATKEVEGCNMHYAKTGNDTLPTITFIHGSPGSWDAFMRYLKDKELLFTTG